ncbi:MAG: hypothetical protein DHS20C15_14430 [Planctomycetota bacterium]|nr:MAG: hypothetical protein DHS20C15_14430 [Planctomycetota bacterium]
MRPSILRCFVILLGVLALAPLSHAQWGSDPATNSALADGASDQTQSKLQPTADGGMYLSWFDGIGTGFDVRLQRVDADGNEVFAHNGVLVEDRSFSSTQDYGLGISANGNALLAYRADSPLNGATVVAEAVHPDGTLGQMGGGSITLADTSDFVAAPKIAGTSDGGAVVAWIQNSSVRLQKLDAQGVKQWVPDVVLTPAVGSYAVADLHAAGNDVILSFVHQTGGFGSPRQLRTQKFDAAGAALWGANHVDVFDSGSLQFGNFPSFVPDGSGGAVFSWYDTGSLALQCYVQRIDRTGAELFAHNGVAVSTNAARIRVSPHAAIDALSGNTIVSWVELSANQAQTGVFTQKFDSAGNRLWGDAGVELVPVSATQVGNVRTLTSADTSMTFWIEQQAFGNDRVHGVRVFADGQTTVGPFSVATTASGKSRLAAASSAHGQSILSWNDTRADAGDIYAQNVNCDGTLGPPSLSAAWTDLGNALAGFSGDPALVGSGALCPGAPFSISLSNARPSSPLAIVLGLNLLAAPLKGGVLVPTPDKIFFNLSSDVGGGVALASHWPASLPAGFELYVQVWVTDAAAVLGFAASNGLRASVP